MVPDPVAFGEGAEEGDEEGEVFADEEGDLVLRWGEALSSCCCSVGVGVMVGGGEFVGDDGVEEEAAVVPYCVVLGVLGEEGGG